MNALWKSNGLGVGGGGSIAVQERAAGFSDLKSMHNFWVELLVDSGIFFFSLFVIWYLRLTFNIYKIYKSHTNAFFSYHAGSLFVSLLTFIIACISASSVIYLLPMWLMFGMSISLLIIYRKEKFAQQGK
jgi:teichuronic acid biosynthesis protein TuaE